MFSHSEAMFIFNSIFQSGSQNDLIDSWRHDTEEDSTSTSDAVSAANARWMIGNQTRNLSAEYPFHKNLCMPPQGINFDLTHKRGMYCLQKCIGGTFPTFKKYLDLRIQTQLS